MTVPVAPRAGAVSFNAATIRPVVPSIGPKQALDQNKLGSKQALDIVAPKLFPLIARGFRCFREGLLPRFP